MTGRDAGKHDEATEPFGYRLHVGNCPRCKSLLAASSFQIAFDGHMGDDQDSRGSPDSEDQISRQDAEDLETFVYAIIEYIYDLADRYEEFTERQRRKNARGIEPLRM